MKGNIGSPEYAKITCSLLSAEIAKTQRIIITVHEWCKHVIQLTLTARETGQRLKEVL